MPPLETQYGEKPGNGRSSCTLDMLMMDPVLPRSLQWRTKALVVKNGPLRFTSITRSYWSSVTSQKSAMISIPALLTSTSIVPKCATAFSISFSQSATFDYHFIFIIKFPQFILRVTTNEGTNEENGGKRRARGASDRAAGRGGPRRAVALSELESAGRGGAEGWAMSSDVVVLCPLDRGGPFPSSGPRRSLRPHTIARGARPPPRDHQKHRRARTLPRSPWIATALPLPLNASHSTTAASAPAGSER